ncbi:MAG: hypothetical protein JOZ02_14725 [Acidobacteria bacterium]|nr:hypothetical protein [Acidobacteriota bacterium]
MFKRSVNVPQGAYLLAAMAGLAGLPLMYLLANLAEVASFYYGEPVALYAAVALLGLGYAILGAAFGFLWPVASWRWGVWLCAGPTCAVPFVTSDARVFLAWALLTLLPACAGAYALARVNRRRARAQLNGATFSL